MLQPRYRWDIVPLRAPDPDLLAMAVRLGISPRVASLLAGRGVADGPALERFFGPPAEGLHDPALLPDADRFRDRIERARASHERVLVFGDFDADGLTGLAILVRVLRRMGLDVEPYVPSRLDEGHGLSMAAVGRAGELGVGLIVTVDCGSTSVAEVAAARSRGIDVLVTDHHRVPAVVPPAVAIVNPHRPDSRYPERSLSGSGVAFKLGQLLLAGEPGGLEFALALADLATIGTVADVAPVLGENRAIARLGLERLRGGAQPGLAALLRRAMAREPGTGRVAGRGTGPTGATIAPTTLPGAADIDLETVAFVLAPRLNAAGRVGEALDAAHLLLTDDPAEADGVAERLETANGMRRELTRQAIAEARTSPDAVADAPATIVRGPWPVGIVGLVAARLAEERARPAIVGADLGDLVRASCRSDSALDLAAALEACADLLLRHGGHAGAAGFELRADAWPAFRERFLAIAEAAGPFDGPPRLAIDLDVPGRHVDYALYRDLARLAPCGPGHAEPLVLVRDLVVVRVREAGSGHTQLILKREPDVLDGIAFGWPELARVVEAGDRLDVVARLGSRRFGGFESLQLEIRDAAPAVGSVPIPIAIETPASAASEIPA